MVPDKIPTGIAGLDEVLFGGIPLNTITVLMGAPGTGKTILAEQFAFENATPESPALYLTTVSEPLEKFIANGQHYGFFDISKIGSAVFYEDLGRVLRDRGVEALADVVAEYFMQISPRFVFIDSFKALNELIGTSELRRTVTFDLASVLAAYQCTSFLVGEYSESMMTELPEFAIADVVVRLLKHSTNVREQRFLKVEKLRASNSIPGMHAFSITNDGIELFPRLLTPPFPSEDLEQLERIASGIEGLDAMFGQGIWRGSTTLVAGPSGSGKTVLGLHFMAEGVNRGEPGIYVAMQENPAQLRRSMALFGWDVEGLLNNGFELMYRSPVELQLDSITTELFRKVRDGKIRRVVIDALGDLERSSVDSQRFSDFIYSLTQWFAAQNVTGLMMFETGQMFQVNQISKEELSNISDNILLLRFAEGSVMQRRVRVIKARASEHDNLEHTLDISNKGVIVTRDAR